MLTLPDGIANSFRCLLIIQCVLVLALYLSVYKESIQSSLMKADSRMLAGILIISGILVNVSLRFGQGIYFGTFMIFVGLTVYLYAFIRGINR